MRSLLPSTLILQLLLGAPLALAQEHPSEGRPIVAAVNFEGLRAQILPGAEELAWKRLDWRASLWEGVIEAQRRERPILLWAMNGHPLGCT